MTDSGINWAAILDELRRKGLGPSAVAEHTQIAKSTLLGWRDDGKLPAHPLGERLLAFWCQVTGKTREDAPRIELFPGTAATRRM